MTLSHHVTEKYNSFKKVVKKSELDIDEHQKTFTNLVSQKEHEIKKLEAEMKDAEGDNRAIESITKASKLLKVEIEDEQQDYIEEREDLIYEMKRNNTKLKELVGLIDETVDECIFSIRRECTNFDNIWIPTEEFQLEASSHFIKYVGFNTVVVQDVDGMIYYLSGSTLTLVHKAKVGCKVFDAFGCKEYICLALDHKKVQFISRKTWDVIKAVNTAD